MSQDKKYDVFVSYKHSRHAADATSLVETLRRGGLTIWFDVDQLVKKNETWISKPVNNWSQSKIKYLTLRSTGARL